MTIKEETISKKQNRKEMGVFLKEKQKSKKKTSLIFSK